MTWTCLPPRAMMGCNVAGGSTCARNATWGGRRKLCVGCVSACACMRAFHCVGGWVGGWVGPCVCERACACVYACDLDVPGSPTRSTLMSPRRTLPVLPVLCVPGRGGNDQACNIQHTTRKNATYAACNQRRVLPVFCVHTRAHARAHTSEEQREDSLLDVVELEDRRCQRSHLRARLVTMRAQGCTHARTQARTHQPIVYVG